MSTFSQNLLQNIRRAQDKQQQTVNYEMANSDRNLIEFDFDFFNWPSSEHRLTLHSYLDHRPRHPDDPLYLEHILQLPYLFTRMSRTCNLLRLSEESEVVQPTTTTLDIRICILSSFPLCIKRRIMSKVDENIIIYYCYVSSHNVKFSSFGGGGSSSTFLHIFGR